MAALRWVVVTPAPLSHRQIAGEGGLKRTHQEWKALGLRTAGHGQQRTDGAPVPGSPVHYADWTPRCRYRGARSPDPMRRVTGLNTRARDGAFPETSLPIRQVWSVVAGRPATTDHFSGHGGVYDVPASLATLDWRRCRSIRALNGDAREAWCDRGQ